MKRMQCSVLYHSR